MSDTNITGTTPLTPAPKPAPPPRPVAAKAPPKGKGGRRFFLFSLFGSWFAIAWTAFTASMIGMLLGTVRFLFPNVLSEPPSKFKVGDPRDYEAGKVVERFKPQGTWIVRYNYPDVGDIIYALSTTCTHLGCTPNWLDTAQKFKCPCHGSGFHITGVNFEGPAPRPLERWAISIADDGQLLVDKSRKFQKELGQWSDQDSFVKM
ncbi:MAG TPA: ubiquinol-cytochrome c reductase iron-sulfur subunit [Gemmataceae bacterium]|nr:ubiquinol-cytochrome c reductase iron-sulfur subunit [Gemmataceae bacterium]